MKKLILVFTLIILLSGCKVKELTIEDIDKSIDEILSIKAHESNNSFKGYKFYIPRGFKLQNKKGNNFILLSNGEDYYLYVDIVSYFHKKEITSDLDNNNLYFSNKISYNDINGYIKVGNPVDDVYDVEIVYNYSKIETRVKSENLEHAIKNSLRILSSIEYNDIILDTMIGEKTLDYQEEVYNFFESKREEGNFLDYIEEYDEYDKQDKVKDEDVLNIPSE